MSKLCKPGAVRPGLAACVAAWLAIGAPAAWAGACRVTDFTDRPLISLNQVEKLSFAMQMTRTEYDRLKGAEPGSVNYDPLIAKSASLADAHQAAQSAFNDLAIENGYGYARFWSHDYLIDEQLRKFADCESARQPGLALYGRSESPGEFHLTYVHITPIGIEKITTKVIASANIANVAELEASLAQLGPQDNYTARTIALKLVDPKKPAVLVMVSVWESPKFDWIEFFTTQFYSN
jgi:hypothetical protein